MSWQVLSAGFPNEPWDYNDPFPEPLRVLKELVAEITAVGLGDAKATSILDDDEQHCEIGLYGDPSLGIRYAIRVSKESSSIDTVIELMTVGLPGIEIRWRYALHQVGQLGRCGYRHTRLEARLDDEGSRARFVATWRREFGIDPQFVAIAAPSEISRSWDD